MPHSNTSLKALNHFFFHFTAMSPVPKEERDKPVDDNPACNNVENDDSVPDFIITLTSSESEAESDADVEYDGYELLPQEIELVELQPSVEAHEETNPVTLLPNLNQSLPEDLCVLPFTVIFLLNHIIYFF